MFKPKLTEKSMQIMELKDNSSNQSNFMERRKYEYMQQK
jgi:hypothetical protein